MKLKNVTHRDRRLPPVSSGLIFTTTLLMLGACAPQSGPPENALAADSPLQVRVPANPVTGEAPADLLEAIITDLAGQENLRREDIEIERAEAVIWPDGSLGCPKPGEMYTHAEVPGYWVVLHAAGQKYDYRAAQAGHFRRCSNPFKIQLPVG